MARSLELVRPVPAGERTAIVDVLRGFALGGVLLVNMQRYVEDLPGILNRLADYVVELLAYGKFYPLFSALFGVGFALQLSRAEPRSAPFALRYLRRLAALLGFGVFLYVVLDRNEILIAYACAGVPLVLLRHAAPRTLASMAAVSLLCAVGAGVALDGIDRYRPAAAAERAEAMASEGERARAAFTSGGYVDLIQIRVEILRNQTHRAWFYAPWLHYFAMFLVGWWAVLIGVFRSPERFIPALRRVSIAGAVAGLPLSALVLYGHALAPQAVWTPGVKHGLSLAAGTALAIAYAAAILQLWLQPAVAPLLGRLAWAGRMSLTNFMLQYAIMVALFHHEGLGLYKRVGSAVSLALTLLIFVAQVGVSGWWLKRFAMGPLEWVWRLLTYGKALPLRRGAAHR